MYVVVVNREKNYDPTINKGRIKKRISGIVTKRAASKVDDSSSSDQEVVKERLEQQKDEIMKNRFKLSSNAHKASANTKPSTAHTTANQDSSDNSQSTTASQVVPRLKRPFASVERDAVPKRSASLYRPAEPKFKWVPPAKVFPEKYGPTKIKIIQDCSAYKHHQTHKINVFFDQANEFVRIMFKNQKASSS